VRALVALALAFAAPIPVEAAEDPVVGHYYLQGVRETGSELLIQPDGRFKWYMSYGAVDQFAEGQWLRDDKQLILNADKVDPEKAQLVPYRVTEWQASTESYLREAMNRDVMDLAAQRCPFLTGIAAATAAHPGIAEPALPSEPEALQMAGAARLAAEQAMAASAEKIDDPQLLEAANAARSRWSDAELTYRRVLWKAGKVAEPLPEPAIPSQCGAAPILAVDEVPEKDWLRGLAVSVLDPVEGVRFGGYDVAALFSDGHRADAFTFGSDMAFLQKRTGHRMVEITITAPWLPATGKTVSIPPMEEGLVKLAIDSALLRRPAFKQMTLTINADGLTNEQWQRGVYRQQ
jgi:hypothetical protein